MRKHADALTYLAELLENLEPDITTMLDNNVDVKIFAQVRTQIIAELRVRGAVARQCKSGNCPF